MSQILHRNCKITRFRSNLRPRSPFPVAAGRARVYVPVSQGGFLPGILWYVIDDTGMSKKAFGSLSLQRLLCAFSPPGTGV